MTYNLYFWCYAYLLTIAALGFGVQGYLRVKRGDISGHHRAMNRATTLILFFVLSYVLKMIVLGREEKSDWSGFFMTVLYIHEAFIFTMLASGTYARVAAARFKNRLGQVPVSPADHALRRRHALAGRTALISTGMALLTAMVVLFGMMRRAGLV